jgi:hypothetical protein
MQVRFVALALGILFLLLGLAGFVPALMLIPGGATPDAPLNVPNLTFSDGYGYLFGLFPTNYLHNAVRIAVGILGIASYTSFGGAILYTRGFAIAYILIALMGLFPFTNTTFGVMPLYGNNVWFNLLAAGIAAYFGFFKPVDPIETGTPSVG